MLPAEEAEALPARSRLPAELARFRSEKFVPDGAAQLLLRARFSSGGAGAAEGFRGGAIFCFSFDRGTAGNFPDRLCSIRLYAYRA